MGIRGLSTFITNNSRIYLSQYKLHDCIIVIDGNNLASQLYVWHSKSNSAFGGDYDRYYKCIRKFFLLLKECKITPLVIFDGGYETRKLGTVWMRLRNKYLVCKKVNPKNQTRKNMFPLLMKEHFRDILIELGISFAQCDFEADEEIAALARELKCPVLSYDSDFFVHDVLYIPFNSIEMSATKSKDSKTGQTFSYISCDIYRVERFLATFGGLQKDMLPIMATVLGNDYIKASSFDGFFAQIHLPKPNREYTYQHRKIAGLLQWLRKENVQSAVSKILGYLKERDRNFVEKQIQRAIESYACTSSCIKEFLIIPTISSREKEECSAIKESSTSDSNPFVESQEEENNEDDEESDNINPRDELAVEYDDTEVRELADLVVEEVEDEAPKDVPIWFLHLFREGLLPSCLMDLLTKNRFYILQPQKEDYNVAQSSHDLSMPLLRYLITLLLGPENAMKVRVVTRHHCTPCHRKLFTEDIKPETNLPSLESVTQLTKHERLCLLMQATNITQSLESIPEEWRLYFLAIAYWANHAKYPPITEKHVHAVILSAILMALVQASRKGMKNRASDLSKSTQLPVDNKPNIKYALENIKITEYAELFSSVYIPHSHAEGRNQKIAYDLSVVHNFAQLQSVMLILTQLNQILGLPLKSIPFHQLFSGTLLYNIFRALQTRNDVEIYVKSCLSQSPSVLALHQALVTTVLEYLAPNTPLSLPRTKPRKKRRRNELSDSSSTKEDDPHKKNKEKTTSDSDSEYADSNNRFALLLTL